MVVPIFLYNPIIPRDTRSVTATQLARDYDQARTWLNSKKLPPDIDRAGVFCNDRTDLREVEVYGFDYDYTLASYKKGVEYLIHDIAKHHLVTKYGYPQDIASLVYDPQFPIRGEWITVRLEKMMFE